MLAFSPQQAGEFYSDLEEFEQFLAAHSQREERGMFAYLTQQFPSQFGEMARKLADDHAEYPALLAQLQGAIVAEEFHKSAALLSARRKELLAHFISEEAACVPLMLILTPQQYTDFQVMAFGQVMDTQQFAATELFPGKGRTLGGVVPSPSSTSTPRVEPTKPVELVPPFLLSPLPSLTPLLPSLLPSFLPSLLPSLVLVMMSVLLSSARSVVPLRLWIQMFLPPHSASSWQRGAAWW